MKHQPLFDKTVGILVKAYFDKTLMHGNCHACAVGNIVAKNCGYQFSSGNKELAWSHLDVYNSNWSPMNDAILWFNVISSLGSLSNYKSIPKKEIDSTGYSVNELKLIEFAFEHWVGENEFTDDVDGYLGLMSVVDCLMLIHEATPEEAQLAKQLFTQPCEN